MGASSSKAARGTARKFPTRPPPSAVSQPVARTRTAPAAELGSKAQSDGSKDDALRADAMDPDNISASFSSRLQQMGIVDPNPTFSPSSTASPEFPQGQFSQGPSPTQPLYPSSRTNTTLSALEARRRLQELADQELESGAARRRFVDIRTVVDAVRLRDNGWKAGDIEAKLGVQDGFVKRLGKNSAVRHVMTGSD